MPNSLDAILAFRPAPPLAQFVELYWLCTRSALPHPRERLLPMGTMELVIQLQAMTQAP
jgi:hypothetical protein